MDDKNKKDEQVQAVIKEMGKPRQATGIATEESEHARQNPAQTVTPDWNTVRQGVQKITEPTPLNPNTKPVDSSWAANRDAAWNSLVNATSVGGNVLKRAGRVVFGAVDFFPQTIDIVHRLFSPDEKVSEQAEGELLNLHPGAQIADRMKEAIDDWRKSKSLAAENVLGDLIGMWVLGRSGRELTPEMRAELTKEGVVLPPEPKAESQRLSKSQPPTIEGSTGAPKINQPRQSPALTQVLNEFHQVSQNRIYESPAATPEQIRDNAQAVRQVKDQIRATAPKPPEGEPSLEWEADAESWLENNRSLVQKLQDLERERYRLRNQNVGEIRQLTDGRKVVFLTREGLRTIANAHSGTYEPDYGMQGATIGKGGVDPTIRMLKDSASPLNDLVAGMIARGRNADGSVTISYKPEEKEPISDIIAVLREELGHAWQQTLTKTGSMVEMLPKGAWQTLNAIIPNGMKAYLKMNGYDLNDPAETVAEAGAKLLAFKPSEFNMSPSEAANFLFQYFQEVEKMHGAKAFEALTHANKLGRQVKGYFSGKQPRTEPRQSQAAVGSVQTGGQGGNPQSPPPPGNGGSPSAADRARLDQLRNIRYQAADQSEPFFLKTEAILADKMRGPMPANAILSMFNGKVKPEELKWTGLQDFLAAKGNTPVTPKEISDVLARNDLTIKEVTRGGSPMDILRGRTKRPLYAKWVLPGGDDYHEMELVAKRQQMDISDSELDAQLRKLAKWPERSFEAKNPADQPKVDQLIGEWNLRNRGFRHDHWPEENVIGHVRWNTRMSVDGKKLLHLEEIQSDWHQHGREFGYVEPLSNKLTDLEKYELREELRSVRNQQVAALRVGDRGRWEELKAKGDDIEARLGVPKSPRAAADAPFRKTWPDLIFKRMLRYAADHGYDGVSWTPGIEQADRYSYADHVQDLRYEDMHDGTYRVSVVLKPVGTNFLSDAKSLGDIPKSKLAETFGKAVAEKIINGEGQLSQPGHPRRVLSGVDLKIGTKGMNDFYDKIIPSVVNDIGKQWGARVGETHVKYWHNGHDVEQTFQYLPVTPEMRQSISSGKQAMFNRVSPAEMQKLDALRSAVR